MNAVLLESYGTVDSVKYHTGIPIPTPSDTQVLVAVHAGAINPFDISIRSGRLKDIIPLTLPITVGGDFAGIVTHIGTNVTSLQKGDHVYGTAITLSGGSGGFADYTVANIEKIAKKPKSINFLESASLVLVGTSAIQALEEHMNLQKNQTILIHGGAGGIGSVAIQLAHHLDAHITTTVRTIDIDYVKKLGAHDVIDFTKTVFYKQPQQFDAVFDTVGGDTTVQSFAVVKKGGILVSMRGQPDTTLAHKFGITAIGQNTQISTNTLEKLTELIDSHHIHPQIDSIFPLKGIQDAYTKLETGHPRGKIVIRIQS
jgi:alcohol dehydrogenase